MIERLVRHHPLPKRVKNDPKSAQSEIHEDPPTAFTGLKLAQIRFGEEVVNTNRLTCTTCSLTTKLFQQITSVGRCPRHIRDGIAILLRDKLLFFRPLLCCSKKDLKFIALARLTHSITQN